MRAPVDNGMRVAALAAVSVLIPASVLLGVRGSSDRGRPSQAAGLSSADELPSLTPAPSGPVGDDADVPDVVVPPVPSGIPTLSPLPTELPVPTLPPLPTPTPAFASIIDDPAKDGVDVGMDPAITFGRDDRFLIAYRDATNQALKVAHCDDGPCVSVTSTTIDDTLDAGYHAAIAIGNDGLGIIAYTNGPEAGAGNLNVAHCANVACTKSTHTVVREGVGGVISLRSPMSIGVRTDGRPVVNFWGNDGLQFARCKNASCTSASIEVVDPSVGVIDAAMAIGSDDLPIISYTAVDPEDHGHLPVRVLHCTDAGCGSFDARTVSDGAAADVGITIAPNGRALIMSRHIVEDASGVTIYELRATNCADVVCSQSTSALIDADDELGYSSAVAIDHTKAVVAYGIGRSIRLATCVAVACVGAATREIDEQPAVGESSVAVGPNGPLVAYWVSDKAPGHPPDDADLKVARTWLER
jgi:hypothetical protein